MEEYYFTIVCSIFSLVMGFLIALYMVEPKRKIEEYHPPEEEKLKESPYRDWPVDLIKELEDARAEFNRWEAGKIRMIEKSIPTSKRKEIERLIESRTKEREKYKIPILDLEPPTIKDYDQSQPRMPLKGFPTITFERPANWPETKVELAPEGVSSPGGGAVLSGNGGGEPAGEGTSISVYVERPITWRKGFLTEHPRIDTDCNVHHDFNIREHKEPVMFEGIRNMIEKSAFQEKKPKEDESLNQVLLKKDKANYTAQQRFNNSLGLKNFLKMKGLCVKEDGTVDKAEYMQLITVFCMENGFNPNERTKPHSYESFTQNRFELFKDFIHKLGSK